MAWGSVQLQPGLNVERTPTLLRAGYSSTSLVRFRDGLAQKYGGWASFYPFNLAGVPRDLHAWQDLNNAKHLAIGSTGPGSRLSVITSGTIQDVSPQTLTSDFAPNISTTAGSPIVAITDPNIANVTVNDSVFFNVPVSIGGLILDGLYPITEIAGVTSYQITAGSNATTTETNPTNTNAVTAAGNNTLHFAATPAWVVAGMVIADLTTPAAIPAGTTVLSTTGTTVVMSANAAGGGVGNGDHIVIVSLPVFTTTLGSAIVSVKLIANGLSVGSVIVFPLATTANGVTIQGTYEVTLVTDANTFSIAALQVATATGSFAMNNGNAELVYFIALGPPPLGAGYGLGGYGLGGYGTGAAVMVQTGTPIAAADWTTDNWGQILLSCPQNGAVYYWDPTSGFSNSQIVSSAPPFNAGLFVSTSEQILVLFGSSVHKAIGWQQQPLLVSWSDVQNFFNFGATAQDQAGSFPIPFGSTIVGGMAVSNQNLIWTDLDLWAMNYIGPPDVFGFNNIGAGMGLVSSHAQQKLRGSVYWMSPTNFCGYTSSGANVIPCPVWDAVFQNLNVPFQHNVRAMPNTPFNEVGWLFPSAASISGECDSYVKFNITEPGMPWDVGPLPRSAWIDQSVLGPPIGATPSGTIYQHETTPDAAGQPLVSGFTTGYFFLGEGEEIVTVDQVWPDFKWSTFTGSMSAQIQMTFLVAYHPGDTPVAYGPFTVTQATQFLSVRFRGRQMAIQVQSSDIGSFWRLGYCRWRYSQTGRQ